MTAGAFCLIINSEKNNLTERKISMKFGKSTKIILSLFLCFAFLVGCANLPLPELNHRSEAEESLSEADGSSSKGDGVKKPQSNFDEAEESSTSLAALREKITESGAAVGAAFLGYIGSSAPYDEVVSFAHGCQCASVNEFLCTVAESNIIAYDGDELFAFVPASNSYAIAIYPAELTAFGELSVDEDNPIITANPGETVVLRCNMGDLYSNVMVRASDGTNSVEFYPMVSLMDGRLTAAEGCYDFSVYSDNSDSGNVGETVEEKNIQIAYELLTEAEEVKNRMELGMVVQYTGEKENIDGRECYIFTLGTDHGDYVVTEYFYGVCDNLIYTYDAVSDSWNALGANG